ncbi:MAG: peptidoglycan DD-metalloendopeptidase family protein [Desulfarculaceae bacterium]
MPGALIIGLLAASLLTAAVQPASAVDTPQAARQELRRRLTTLLDRQEKLTKASTQAEKKLLQMKNQLTFAQKATLRLAQETQKTRTQLSQTKARVQELSAGLEHARLSYAKRLRALYLHGPEASIYLLASAPDFNDALRRSQRLTFVLQTDKKGLDSLRRRQIELASFRSHLAHKQNQLIENTRQYVKQQDDLKSLRQSQIKLIASLKERKQQLAANISALEEALGRLARTFAPDDQGSPRLRPKGGVLAAKGGLSPPADGRVLGRSGRRGQGIILACRAGAPVRSPWWGKVVFAGPLTGYGNLAVLDHGERVHTVLAHLGSLSVEAGREVQAGDLVGTVNRSGRLYLEIRRGARPQNPLQWLRLAP